MKHYHSLILSGLICSALYLSTVGCTSSYFSQVPTPLGVQSLTPPDSAPPICTPFGGSTGGSSSTNGISAVLTYLPSNGKTMASLNANSSNYVTMISPNTFDSNSAEKAPDLVTVPAQFILNTINAPTVDFTQGFTDSAGKPLIDLSGQKLTSYFSLHMDADLMLNAGDLEGNYQFASLADDGSNTYLDGTLLIANPGPHASAIACSTQTIRLARGVPHKFHMDWYQGPPTRLASMLFWRLNPTTLADPNCPSDKKLAAQRSGDNYYFTNGPSGEAIPTPQFTQFSPNTGWNIVPASNFYLPNNQTNPCVTK